MKIHKKPISQYSKNKTKKARRSRSSCYTRPSDPLASMLSATPQRGGNR